MIMQFALENKIDDGILKCLSPAEYFLHSNSTERHLNKCKEKMVMSLQFDN